jgi:hypothetical protein
MKTPPPGSPLNSTLVTNQRPAKPAEEIKKSSAKAAMQTQQAGSNKETLPSPGSRNAESSHTAPVTTGRVQQRIQAIPADIVKKNLSDANGPFNRQQLVQYASSDITEKDMQTIPRTWPTELISAKDIWSWGDALVKAHQAIYDKQGKEAYVKAIIAAIFPDDPEKPFNFPVKLNAICQALDKQVILQCRQLKLTKDELDDVRMRVVGGFLYGRVLCSHLQPIQMRAHVSDADKARMDESLLSAIPLVKRNRFLETILSVNDPMLEPARAPQAQAQASQSGAIKKQVIKIIGSEMYRDIQHTGNAEDFYAFAADYLNSSVKDKEFMLTALFILCKQMPERSDKYEINLWKKAEKFIFDARHKLDNLTPEGKLYFLQQLELIAFPDRPGTLKSKLLKDALRAAEGILPAIEEDNENLSSMEDNKENDSTS